MFLVSWERKQYWLNTMEPPVVVLKQSSEVAMVPQVTGTGLPLSGFSSPPARAQMFDTFKEMRDEAMQATRNNQSHNNP